MSYKEDNFLKPFSSYRRKNKWVANESETAVMDVTSFLCVSLGSSTVQLHDSLDAHARFQRLVSVVKMATVLEGYSTEEQRCAFFIDKRTQCRRYY
jgi:hypothetical protein